MFGYLTARTDLLDEDRIKRYKACYCGLCRSLRSRHGPGASLTLNFDMTFLVLLLSSLYEPEEKSGCETCAAHPVRPRERFYDEFTDYAADMNVALGYLKCLDNWEDDGSLLSAAEAKLLKRAYGRICERYPRQCGAMEQSIRSLGEIERQNREAPDEAAATFGVMLGEIFDLRGDRWSRDLRATGEGLGRFLYIMDACMDLDADALHGSYNPFRRYYGLDNAARFRSILQMLLGECVRAYDRLPLVQDKDLLDNILCAGTWAQFDKKFLKEREGSSDVPGPV